MGERWVFDELPPSGARRGGDPSKHAFRHDLGTFVREVVQNANDQAVAAPRVRFELRELTGESLRRFREAMSWRTLAPHLRGAAHARGGRALREALEGEQGEGRLMLLGVEDRGTIGLVGDETKGESHFRALCKDTLYSHKDSESAGGSYGLGKSVLWTFSSLSTVLFSSVLLEDGPGQRSPRLIGRTELPSHAVRRAGVEQWYTGSGWFGREVAVGPHASRAESVWGRAAAKLSERLGMGRPSEAIGTTILIVGFRDPTSESEDRVPELSERMRKAAVAFFWPAMAMPRRRLKVTVGTPDGEVQASAAESAEVAPFVECYERRHAAGSALDAPGDVVVRRIPVDLPDPRSGARSPSAEVDLVVRLAPESARDPLLNHVALFRGPGMVIRYWNRANLTIGMRPFHAVLVCGEARDPTAPTPADTAVEHFLRAAEPPGHDEWTSTARLKDTYKRGYARALARLHERVSEELRILLMPAPRQGRKGPDRLQKRFPIGARGGRGSEPSLFHFTDLDATFDGARWRFRAEVSPTEHGHPWQAVLSLREVGEDGTPLDTIAIDDLSVESDGAAVRLEEGAGLIDAERERASVVLRGTSAAVIDPTMPGELSLEITGRLLPEVSA